MNLVIVESPAKAKTIEKYLGKDFKVMASLGHVIDLPKSNLAVDLEKDYAPDWVTIRGKGVVIKKLKKAVPKDGDVYLAMDRDREGEAIAWHLMNALKLKDPKRITFNEITKKAVTDAIKKPSKVDISLVDSQIARRVLDRLVGYRVSELLWKKIWYGLSAGRVQSVALRLIVEREDEIDAFNPKEFWEVFVDLDNNGNIVNAKLAKKAGKKIVPEDKKEVDEIEKVVDSNKFKVVSVKVRNVKKHAYPPFTTSTIQQRANSVLGFTAKRTMGVAQALYQKGYITYMRTDSVNLSNDAIKSIRKLIPLKYGKEYLPEKANYYKNKSKNAQEAHEAIRPTDFSITVERIKKEFGEPEAKLYQLIWNRTVASQMSERRSEILTVELNPDGVKDPIYSFTMGGEKVLFDGFRKVLGSGKKDEGQLQQISSMKEGDLLDFKKFISTQKFTKPRARYSEASLVKMLEELGVGRPSTYATIITTVQNRGYVLKEGKQLVPTNIGRVVANFLKDHFARLVDFEYTAKVEEKLDMISEGKVEYAPFIDAEFKPLTKEIEKALDGVNKEDVVILGDAKEKCPDCKGKMVIRLGRYGKFYSCANFPECKGMKDLDGGEDKLDFDKYSRPEKCPKCEGPLKLKMGKYGKFWACGNYPECKGTVPMLLKINCPDCKSKLVERRSKWGKMFTGCSGYPDCKYIQKEEKKKKEEK